MENEKLPPEGAVEAGVVVEEDSENPEVVEGAAAVVENPKPLLEVAGVLLFFVSVLVLGLEIVVTPPNDKDFFVVSLLTTSACP